jgi:hypothetical protein
MHHPLNLRVLQRQDPTISAILESTSYAVLYDFTDDRWHKTGKEGTLFLYERDTTAAPGPSRGLFLLNRSSPENFNHPILPSTELDMQGKVLMIEDAGPDDCASGSPAPGRRVIGQALTTARLLLIRHCWPQPTSSPASGCRMARKARSCLIA